MLKHISIIYNFTYSVIDCDFAWGSLLPNKTWTGIIGLLDTKVNIFVKWKQKLHKKCLPFDRRLTSDCLIYHLLLIAQNMFCSHIRTQLHLWLMWPLLSKGAKILSICMMCSMTGHGFYCYQLFSSIWAGWYSQSQCLNSIGLLWKWCWYSHQISETPSQQN